MAANVAEIVGRFEPLNFARQPRPIQPPRHGQGHDHRHQQQVADGKFHRACSKGRPISKMTTSAIAQTIAVGTNPLAKSHIAPARRGGAIAITIIRLRRLYFMRIF